MDFNTLKPASGSTKNRKRIGRGAGSGHGKTATKGHKGQKARSGGSIKAGFEGGQMPLQRRVPKRGFTSINKIIYSVVNINALDAFETGAVIDNSSLAAKGLIKSASASVKILGTGDVTKAYKIAVSKISASAKEKVIAAGGSVEETI